ncbi:hypothetical protein BKA70DRAFT_744903 [Coprinopsis sp. MPI-PUGE-AT-0042]|nr:hypothetical protein BKA70DRAFT_744903 [Coprinopsis sp. MPI-PUGE-AT-0042]
MRSLLFCLSLAAAALSIFFLDLRIHKATLVLANLRRLVSMSDSADQPAKASQWAKERLGQFFGDTEGLSEDFVKNSFAKDSRIVVNGEELSVDEFMQQLQSVAATTTKAVVTWGKVSESENGDQSAVTGSFTVARTMKFRIRVGPAQTNESISFSSLVSPQAPNDQPFVMNELDIRTESQAEPIHLQDIPQ